MRLLAAFVLCACASHATAQLPNVVIILADDLGYGDPRCYNDESKIPTPHIDRLAAEGMRFTDAHSPSSVCSPTRYGLLTGRYAWRTVLKSHVLWPWDGPLIAPDRLTMPAMLRSRGYHTACIGKWHLGWEWPDASGEPIAINESIPIGKNAQNERTPWAAKVDFTRRIAGGPTARGFDHYFGDDVPNFPPRCWIEDDRLLGVPDRPKPAEMFGAPGPTIEGWDLTAVMPELTRRAVAYIDERARTDEPFFLYLPLTAPHTPIAPADEFLGESAAGRYGDFVHQLDWTVGQLLAALARNGLAGETLLIFTSDNGSPQRDGRGMSGPTGSVKRTGHDPSRPWRGMKADIWEGGHRVPFVVRWPGRVAAGTTSAEPIVLTDLMRTIAAVVDCRLPVDAAEDSFDILPALLGDGEHPTGGHPTGEHAVREHPIRDHMIHHSHHGVFAIREGRWKLILGRGSGGFTRFTPPDDAPPGQLYDLEADPAETDNRWNDEPQVVARLEERLTTLKRRGRTAPRE